MTRELWPDQRQKSAKNDGEEFLEELADPEKFHPITITSKPSARSAWAAVCAACRSG